MNEHNPILSRHRLPTPYRQALASLWAAPVGMLLVLMLARGGAEAVTTDLRPMLLLAIMLVPAFYIWNEGVDVRRRGMQVRIHVPRYYAFTALAAWSYDARPGFRVLTVWNRRGAKALECRASQLTDLPDLLEALRLHLHQRPTPTAPPVQGTGAQPTARRGPSQ
ncbi:MAG: hypothetical protein SNJ59_12135 [Aggregatilineales bacterium]